MNPVQNLYYALGEACYAIAKVDGSVQSEESNKLRGILEKEFAKNGKDFDYAEIIFEILRKDSLDPETAFEWALNHIRVNSHYLSEEMKDHFESVLVAVAEAFPPATDEEMEMIRKFKRAIRDIKGDPVFTGEK
jgi:tellurite resistance protein